MRTINIKYAIGVTIWIAGITTMIFLNSTGVEFFFAFLASIFGTIVMIHGKQTEIYELEDYIFENQD